MSVRSLSSVGGGATGSSCRLHLEPIGWPIQRKGGHRENMIRGHMDQFAGRTGTARRLIVISNRAGGWWRCGDDLFARCHHSSATTSSFPLWMLFRGIHHRVAGCLHFENNWIKRWGMILYLVCDRGEIYIIIHRHEEIHTIHQLK